VSRAVHFEELAARIGAADVSSLIALRALASHADATGAVGRAAWLTALQEEYRRWYASERSPVAPSGAGQVVNFPGPDTVRYLDEHIVRHLAADGALHALADDDGALAREGAPWQAVRLTPWAAAELADDRDGVLDTLDRRIRAILTEHATVHAAVDAEPSAEPAPRRGPVLVEGGSTLSARGLVKVYRKRRVVNDVDLHVAQGEIVGLLGPNGAGKTTSFYMMVGLVPPDGGTVRLDERELTGVPMYRRARAGIGYLAQEPSVFRRLTVEENILAVLQMMKIPKAEQRRRLETLLDELSIKHLRRSYAYALSGGERRRLEITRALVGQPKFMLLDEPFAGVDPIAVHDIQQIVSDLRRRGIGVLISDHNVEQTLDIVDRAYIMYDGRVRVSGTVSELVWNDEVAEIYLGPTLTARMRERYSSPDEEIAV
jgi:lipopolysaccharide export system ATP-binding protein